jgi:hypothetical protein
MTLPSTFFRRRIP